MPCHCSRVAADYLARSTIACQARVGCRSKVDNNELYMRRVIIANCETLIPKWHLSSAYPQTTKPKSNHVPILLTHALC